MGAWQIREGRSGVPSLALLLAGCAATTTAISKRNLDVQTKMTESIFLDPVPADQRTVYVQVRNTSDKPDFDIEPAVRSAIESRGYPRGRRSDRGALPAAGERPAGRRAAPTAPPRTPSPAASAAWCWAAPPAPAPAGC